MKTKKERSKKKNYLKFISNVLILSGVLVIGLIFYSPVVQEIKYRLRTVVLNPKYIIHNTKYKEENIVPVSTDFGIVIPKINANAKIFYNVNPYDKKEFLPVLKKGVAHAKGTFFPGGGKNIYLFAHSTDAFYNAGSYNAVFFLIGKLNKGDEIDIYYKGQLFKYFVFEKKVVGPQATEYLKHTNEEILTLQTCYPPGTTLRRLIVFAKLSS